MKPGQLQVLLVAASILLGVGLFAPCMTLQPSYGNVTWLARLIDPDLVAPTTYSLLDGIRSLLTDSNVFIGVVVLLFSVVFPLWKLGVYWAATAQLASPCSTCSCWPCSSWPSRAYPVVREWKSNGVPPPFAPPCC